MQMIGRAHETPVEGTSIAWGEMGEGEPLVLLHGVWDSHRTWRRAAPLLAERFRVLMPDLPGHGFSGRPDAPYTLSWYARTICAWMGTIGVACAHVCGHSYGGGVAQWMLLEDQSRIDRLALVASGGLGREVMLGLRLATFPVYGPLIAPTVMQLGAPLMMRIAAATFGHNEPEEIDRFARMSRIPGSARAFRRSVGGVINPLGQYMQTWQRIGEVDPLPPVAAFWGEKDPIIPLRHGLAARSRLEGATLSVYPRSGHYPHLDSPVRFARELTEFLDDPFRPRARLLPCPRGERWGLGPWRDAPPLVNTCTMTASELVDRLAALPGGGAAC
jgi:pimeloyl-ACP methyl ester carboxylesterase